MKKKPLPPKTGAKAVGLSPKPAPKTGNPSDRLAVLLRKEGLLAAKVRKAQEEMAAVQRDIASTWEARLEQNRQLLENVK